MNYNWLEVSAKTKEGNRCRAHVMVLRRQLFVVFGLREETGAVLSFTALLLCTWVHTHTSYTHTHNQMRSVAEGFYLSSVPSSIEVKADCSNKGVPAFKQDSHKAMFIVLQEVCRGKRSFFCSASFVFISWKENMQSVNLTKDPSIFCLCGIGPFKPHRAF